MAAALFVFSGLFVFIAVAALAEQCLPARVVDKIFRLFGIEEGL